VEENVTSVGEHYTTMQNNMAAVRKYFVPFSFNKIPKNSLAL
jgi:hypothetical protein